MFECPGFWGAFWPSSPFSSRRSGDVASYPSISQADAQRLKNLTWTTIRSCVSLHVSDSEKIGSVSAKYSRGGYISRSILCASQVWSFHESVNHATHRATFPLSRPKKGQGCRTIPLQRNIIQTSSTSQHPRCVGALAKQQGNKGGSARGLCGREVN